MHTQPGHHRPPGSRTPIPTSTTTEHAPSPANTIIPASCRNPASRHSRCSAQTRASGLVGAGLWEPCSGRCGFAVAGRWLDALGRLKAFPSASPRERKSGRSNFGVLFRVS